MIVCVRDVRWILDSFEQLNAKNPYTIKALYNHQELGSVHDRCAMLMGEIPNAAGYVRAPMVNVQQAMFANEYQHLCFVEYDTLVNNPRASMQEIYEFLGEHWFEHDFTDVEDSYDEFDEGAKIKGLHTVRREVRHIQRRSILPGELWDKYQGYNFWKDPGIEQGRKLNWIQGTGSKTESPTLVNTLNPSPVMQSKTPANPLLKYPVPSGFRQL
jgi:sulfotransferase